MTHSLHCVALNWAHVHPVPPCNCGAERRALAMSDLNVLLSFPRLGEWGMEALKDTLSVLLPNEKLHD